MKSRARILTLILTLTMLVSIFAVTAIPSSAANITSGTTLYLNADFWDPSSARFAAYFYGSSGDAWADCIKTDEDGIYEVTAPSGTWTNVIFCRMNLAYTTNSWNTDSKQYVYNQTGDLTYDGTKNLFTVSQWDGQTSGWSTFTCSHNYEGATCQEVGVCSKCKAEGELGNHSFGDNGCTVCGLSTLYLTPDANWFGGNARFAAYFYDASGNYSWVDLTDSDYDLVYEVKIPEGEWTGVIFCRMNPDETENSWDNKWNQTGNLALSEETTCYVIATEGDDWSKGSWTEYVYAEPLITVTGDADLCNEIGWTPGAEANKMTLVNGVYTIVYKNVAEGTYTYKITLGEDWNHGVWTNGSAGDDDNNSKVVVGEDCCIVTITFDPATKAVVATPDNEHNYSDDGDCTTAVVCLDCETVITAANASHTAGADDGDCTTAIKCVNCNQDAVAANGSHSFTSYASNNNATCGADGTKTATCDNCSATNTVADTGSATGNHSWTDGVCTTCKTECTHNYTDGTCSVCGAADPDYEASGDSGSSTTASSYIHNFTESGMTSNFFTITGNLSTGKGSVTYNDLTLTQCLKIESSTNITFTAKNAGTLTLVFGGSTSASGKAIMIDETSTDIDSTQILTVDLAAGTHTITKDDSIFLFYMSFVENSGSGDSGDDSGDSGDDSGETSCSHTNTTTTTVNATCTTAGSTTVTCDDCDEIVSTEEIKATGHTYVDGVCSCGAEDPNYVAPAAGTYIHNFTESGTTSRFYTITGSLSTSKGSVTYNDLTLTQCLKIESSTNITFTAKNAGTLTLVFGGSTSASGKAIMIDETSTDIDSTQILTVDLAAGTHTITKDDSIFLFYMSFVENSGSGDSGDDSGDSGSDDSNDSNEETTESLDIFASTGTLADDSESISWTNGNITFTNAKNESTTAIRTSDEDHFRVYQSNITTISGTKITKVVITCVTEDYASVCASSLQTTGVTATTNGSTVTLTVDSGTLDSIEFKTTTQWRLSKIEVTYGGSGNTCVHTNTTTVTEDATCTEAGSEKIVCDDCGITLSTTEIEATGHNYVDGACSGCGAADPDSGTASEYTATIDYTTYSNKDSLADIEKADGKVTIVMATGTGSNAPTYYTSGSAVRVYGGNTVTISVADGYEIVSIVVNANSSTYLKPENHTIDNGTVTAGLNSSAVTITPTDGTSKVVITNSGSSGNIRFSSIDVVYKAVSSGDSDCSHTDVSEATVPATCTSAAKVVVTCNDCGATVSSTESGEALGHVDENSDYKCDRDGCTEIVPPAADSVLTIEQALALGALTTTTNKYYLSGTITGFYGTNGTTYGNVYIKNKNGASILIYGLYLSDGDVRYDSMETKPVVGDTITAYGIITSYSGVAQMGNNSNKNYLTAHTAHEHNYGEGEVTTAATCTTAGVRTYTCSICSGSYTVAIDKLGHSYDAVVTAPTCTTGGYTTYTCSVCGDTYTDDEVDALGHKYVNGECANDDCDNVIVYFVNSDGWASVYVHYWTDNGDETTWPGEEATKTGDSVHGFDIYEIEFADKREKIIFNNDSGTQTANLDFNAGKYYYFFDNTWYDSVETVPAPDPLATGNFLAGGFNEWNATVNQFKLKAEGESVGYLTIHLAVGEYEFKVVAGSDWLGNTGTITDTITGWVFEYGDGSDAYNCTLVVAVEGDYVFSFDSSTKQLSVEYPHVCDFSDEWSTNDTHHWHECECGEKKDYAVHDHSEEWSTNDTYHWNECDCGHEANKAAHDHSEEWSTNDTYHWNECECGHEANKAAHDHSEEWSTDDTHHWHECECGHEANKAAHDHSEEWSTDDTYHWNECECGHEANKAAHDHSEEWSTNDTYHWHECECGHEANKAAHDHSEEWSTDDTHHWNECECGHKANKAAHDHSEEWSTDDTHHWHECECGHKANKAAHDHSKEWSTDDTHHWHKCDCGNKTDVAEHNYVGNWQYDDDNHWKVCECDATNKTGHSYNAVVTAPTFDAQGYTTHTCSECGDSYVDSYVDALVAVAMIGETKYASLQEALDAAADGDTVTLVKDIEASKYLDVKTANNGETARSIKLDLNGYSITPADDYVVSDYPLVFVGINQTLTITGDGTISCHAGITVGVYGTLHFNGGTIINTGTTEKDGAINIYYWNHNDSGYEGIVGGTGYIDGGKVEGNVYVDEGDEDGKPTLAISSGVYYNDISDHLAEGVECVAVIRGMSIYSRSGSTQTVYYVGEGVLAEVIANASSGDIIILESDIELSEYLDIYMKDESARTLTLDLNGYTISPAEDYEYSDYPLVFVGINQTLTITGEGTITADERVTVGVYGFLTVEGGKIETTATSDEGAAIAIYYWNYNDEGYAGIVGGTGSIVGGEIIGDVYCDEGDEDGDAVLKISGGTFTTDVTKYLEDGYALDKNADGTYGVVEAVAKVNGIGYASVADAYAAANAGDTILLLKDVNAGEVVLDKDVIIEGNGHTLTAVIVINKADITVNINDTKLVGIEGQSAVLTLTADAKLYVNGGSIAATGSGQFILLVEETKAAYAYIDAELVPVDGEIFSGDPYLVAVYFRSDYASDLAVRGFVTKDAGNDMIVVKNTLPYKIGSDGYWYFDNVKTDYKAVADDGVSPSIGDNGNWWIGNVDTGVRAEAIDGNTPEIGDNGNWWIGGVDTGKPAKGQDGVSPSIGDNGNWYIGKTDTGIPATGENGITPHIGENGNWFIGKTDTGVSATGADGKTPYIGANGNWYIGNDDTEIPAKGQDGQNGKTPYIQDGYWYIDGKNTNVPATGENGKTPYIKDGYWYINGESTGVKAEGIDGNTPYIKDGYWYIDGESTGVPATGENGKTPYIKDGYWYIGEENTNVKAEGIDGTTPHIKDGYWYIGEENTNVKAEGIDGTTPHIKDGYWYIGETNTNVLATGADGKTPYIKDGYWYIDGESTGVPATGENGKTPYIKDGYWYIGETNTNVPATGENGKTPYIKDGYWYINGENTNVKAEAIDGQTPHIGENGNWYIGETDTGVKAQGDSGLTPHIGENGNWYIGETDTGVKAQGDSGLTPHIGENGNWYIGETDTGVKAKGENGLTPYIKDGNWWIGEIDTGLRAIAQDGKTPHIGENGNWYIGDTDTGKAAIAKDGVTPHIGENGNWYIGETDTGVKAKGEDGKTPVFKIVDGHLHVSFGDDVWEDLGNVTGADGETPYIGENGNWWIGDEDTGVSAAGAAGRTPIFKIAEDGYLYVSYDNGENWTVLALVKGEDGSQGAQGEPGKDGNDNNKIVIICIGIAALCIIVTIVAVSTKKFRRPWWILC